MQRRFAHPLLLVAVTCSVCAPASVGYTAGTPQQVAWVRSAASKFVRAELHRDGAGACAVLIAPLRAPRHGRTCAQRWHAQLGRRLSDTAARAHLHRDARAIASASVEVHGNSASIELPSALMGGHSRFVWTENCWMLEP